MELQLLNSLLKEQNLERRLKFTTDRKKTEETIVTKANGCEKFKTLGVFSSFGLKPNQVR